MLSKPPPSDSSWSGFFFLFFPRGRKEITFFFLIWSPRDFFLSPQKETSHNPFFPPLQFFLPRVSSLTKNFPSSHVCVPSPFPHKVLFLPFPPVTIGLSLLGFEKSFSSEPRTDGYLFPPPFVRTFFLTSYGQSVFPLDEMIFCAGVFCFWPPPPPVRFFLGRFPPDFR